MEGGKSRVSMLKQELFLLVGKESIWLQRDHLTEITITQFSSLID